MEENRICERLKDMGTSSVSDALDRLGIPGGLLGIHRVGAVKKICGRAFTVRYVPCGICKNSVGDFIDDVKPGQIVVIDNHGRKDCTVWGDIMSIYAVKHKIEGTVIDGVCRDLDSVLEHGYPIYSQGAYMTTGKDRVQCDAVNVPVSITGKLVNPGDYILADESGAIVIPQEKIDEVLKTAEIVVAAEERIVQAILQGSTLKEARAVNGYHHLQTREE